MCYLQWKFRVCNSRKHQCARQFHASLSTMKQIPQEQSVPTSKWVKIHIGVMFEIQHIQPSWSIYTSIVSKEGTIIGNQQSPSRGPQDRNPEGYNTLCIHIDPTDMARRWPLALRFIKGAIHIAIILPVTLHGLFAALIVFLDLHLDGRLSLPTSIVRPSASLLIQSTD